MLIDENEGGGNHFLKYCIVPLGIAALKLINCNNKLHLLLFIRVRKNTRTIC